MQRDYPDGRGLIRKEPKIVRDSVPRSVKIPPPPRLLEYCSWCGRSNVIMHPKYQHMCETCGKRYHTYMSYKSYDKAGTMKPRRDRAFADMKAFYMEQQKLGRSVPVEFRNQ